MAASGGGGPYRWGWRACEVGQTWSMLDGKWTGQVLDGGGE